MLRRLFQLLVLLLPVGAFALSLGLVEQMMFGGYATKGILLFLGALAVLVAVELCLFRYWILPGWGEKLAHRLYAGAYLPEQDALAQLVAQMEETKDTSSMPQLQKLVQQQPRRMRGWLELARLQLDLCADASAACATLEAGAAAVRDPEDAALLLYRAARVCQQHLADAEKASGFLRRAATDYPATVYGRRALSLLNQ